MYQENLISQKIKRFNQVFFSATLAFSSFASYELVVRMTRVEFNIFVVALVLSCALISTSRANPLSSIEDNSIINPLKPFEVSSENLSSSEEGADDGELVPGMKKIHFY